MPWESRTVKEQREGFAETAAHSSNFSAVCREYGITRKTGYKWLERYEAGEELSDRSREPHHIPHKTPPEMEAQILRVRKENPGWGSKTIKQVLENEGLDGRSSSRFEIRKVRGLKMGICGSYSSAHGWQRITS